VSVTVKNGVNSLTGDLAGRTVADVRSMLRQALNIASEAGAYVNGEIADSERVLENGDKLEFIKASGQKRFTSNLASGECEEDLSLIRPDPDSIVAALTDESEGVKPFLAIRSDPEYDAAVTRLNALLDQVGDDSKNPRYRLIETLSVLIEAYDREHHSLPKASGIEVLRFLMEEHGLTQKDLLEIGSQGVVSEVLSGKRALNLGQIRALASRFGVQPGAFIATTDEISLKRAKKAEVNRKSQQRRFGRGGRI
jgi:HTH-type transcriptional regulator / antitoxin HigA